MKRLWILLLIAGIAIMALSAFQYLTRPSSGDPAPAFTLTSIDGRDAGLDGFRGRPILVHFFASWCGVCREEFPSIVRLQKDLEASGLVVLGIAEDGPRDAAALRQFVNALQPSFPILLDGTGAVADAYQSWAVPESIFVDRRGIIAWRHGGPVNWDAEKVREKVNELIATE